MRSVADSSLVHSSGHIPPVFFTPLTIVKINHFSATYIFVTTTHICATMMRFDHNKFSMPFAKLSTSPYCTNMSCQYNGTHYNNKAQHGTWCNSTECTTLPLPGESQRTHLSTINLHNARPVDSAYFAQPMSNNSASTCCSLSLDHLCNDSLASSIRIISCIGIQYPRTVPNVDIVGSSKCCKRHLATGGVAPFQLRPGYHQKIALSHSKITEPLNGVIFSQSTQNRTKMILSTPLNRAKWFVSMFQIIRERCV